MPSRGYVCANCGYKIRKFAIQCPRCRNDLTSDDDNLEDALGRLALKYLEKIDAYDYEHLGEYQ